MVARGHENKQQSIRVVYMAGQMLVYWAVHRKLLLVHALEVAK